ncbi:PREDICTED: uncharacterized protein LOC104814605 [Tarenaya hassleriana]|uniref:uncharacterized protein LOC104814605 n=1 Tax=Tarenaya hassleriana TaxID=28532 RepID=UPI00053C48AC|nr:PREDICTED: uncharacterized protein LOC104814605 [Tarenaya hassleriana]
MVEMDRIVLAAVSLALFASSAFLPVSECAKKPETGPRKEDVPYIKCQVCEKLSLQLLQQVKKKQEQISPKKISEYQIIEIAENVCNLKKEEADWILKIDLVEKGDRLEMVEQDAEGLCNSECKTIENACQQVIGYTDTDVAEYIYKSKPELDSLVNYLCKDLTDACSKNPPPLPKDRVPGEAFKPKPTKEAEMDKIMRSMEGIPGAPGMKVFSREDLEKYKNNPERLEDEDDDDDDDEEDNFPKNLGKALREKESKKEGWKKKITKEIKNTGEAVKRHALKVSNRVKRWWRKLRSSSSSKKRKSEL